MKCQPLSTLQGLTYLLPPCCLPCRPLSARRRSTVDEVQAVAQAGLDFIRNVSINSIITGAWMVMRM